MRAGLAALGSGGHRHGRRAQQNSAVEDTSRLIAMADPLEVPDIVDAALYGRTGQKKALLGNALYELKEQTRKCCRYTAEVATFYPE